MLHNSFYLKICTIQNWRKINDKYDDIKRLQKIKTEYIPIKFVYVLSVFSPVADINHAFHAKNKVNILCFVRIRYTASDVFSRKLREQGLNFSLISTFIAWLGHAHLLIFSLCFSSK